MVSTKRVAGQIGQATFKIKSLTGNQYSFAKGK